MSGVSPPRNTRDDDVVHVLAKMQALHSTATKYSGLACTGGINLGGWPQHANSETIWGLSTAGRVVIEGRLVGDVSGIILTDSLGYFEEGRSSDWLGLYGRTVYHCYFQFGISIYDTKITDIQVS